DLRCITDEILQTIANVHKLHLEILLIVVCGALYTYETIKQLVLTCPRLTEIGLSEYDTPSNAQLLELFSLPNHIQRLHITWNAVIYPKIIREILKKCPQINFFHCYNCDLVSFQDMIDLMEEFPKVGFYDYAD